MENNLRIFAIVSALFTLILTSCITYAQSYVTQNPDIAPEIKQAILEHRIIKGMNPAEVIASWGMPERKIWVPDETSNIREYKKFIYIAKPSSSMRICADISNYDRLEGFGMSYANTNHTNITLATIYFTNNLVISIEIDEGN